MRQWIRAHLTYANVIATLALFLVLSGGTAVALKGSNTVFSDDIVDNQVGSADVRNDSLSGGGLTAADLRPDSVGSSEVKQDSLTGANVDESRLGAVPELEQARRPVGLELPAPGDGELQRRRRHPGDTGKWRRFVFQARGVSDLRGSQHQRRPEH